jgi:hypothetical protein
MEKVKTGRKGGGTPEISHILIFYWFEPVLYLDPVSKCWFRETTERSEYFVGFADNVGGALTFMILKNNLKVFKSTKGKYQNRYQGKRTPDISHILMFYWFETVLYCIWIQSQISISRNRRKARILCRICR